MKNDNNTSKTEPKECSVESIARILPSRDFSFKRIFGGH